MDKKNKFDKKVEEKKIKEVFRVYDAFMKKREKLANFPEPVLFLIRNNNRVQYIPAQTGKKCEFIHSDGEERYILLDQAQQLTFDYGDQTFKGFICHEDEAMPYPHRPILYAQSIQVLIDKIMNDIKTWKAREHEAIGSKWLKVGGAIALVILAFALYQILKPSTPEVVVTVARNLTPGIVGG